MTNKDLADLIFPNLEHDVEYYEKLYPERNLPEGAYVTRFAPSPTGYMHIGNFMSTTIDYVLAKNTNGVFYLRNEDTDKAREISDAVEKIMDTLKEYEMVPDEYEFNNKIVGNYGPYIQSERIEIYHTFIKKLIEMGRAYPCFCSKESLDELRKNQEEKKMRTGYYGRYAKCRNLSIEEAITRIKNGESYVIRFKSMGNYDKKFVFDDLVKGRIEFPENDQDTVIMKSDNFLPTYHFAHLVDDHLMHTTHVVRGEEWLSSVPLHIELFKTFGYKVPKYIHIPLIMKQDGDIKRKISKRKDPEASMSFYREKGYPSLAVIESIMTIINSNYEEWHNANPDKTFIDFKFSPKKMSSSGALYDLEKLNNISRNYISKLTKDEVYNGLLKWTKEYDKEFYELITKYEDYTKNILNIEREQKKPRKDYACYSEIKNQIFYMYDELYSPSTYEWGTITSKEEINKILNTYINKYYDITDKEVWFNNIKLLTDELGYSSNMKEYKENPDNYKGSVADISTVLRVALTSKSMTPDLYEIMRLLGKDRIIERIKKLEEEL